MKKSLAALSLLALSTTALVSTASFASTLDNMPVFGRRGADDKPGDDRGAPRPGDDRGGRKIDTPIQG